MGSLKPNDTSVRAQRVCVIGAGASGLAMAKYLSAEKAFTRITIFEQGSDVGGIWNYTPVDEASISELPIPQTSPHTGLDSPRWHSENFPITTIREQSGCGELHFTTALYDGLETNIPRGLMGFSDLDWPEACQLFPQHEEVLRYIKRYAEDVRDLVKLQTQVTHVRRLGNGRWSVSTQEIRNGIPPTTHEHEFDAVVVANGHYNVPHIPYVTGIEAWHKAYPGAISHSKFYRRAQKYAGKRVVVVGNSASGLDIGAQIAAVATTIIQSQKSESYLGSLASANKIEKPEIVEYIERDRSLRFADGTVETHIDAVLYCTGYFYSYPFLDSLDPAVITTGRRVENTYQHMFYRHDPSLAFLALNQKVIPFPVAEAQSAVIARVFAGRLSLPDQEVMKSWEDGVVAESGEGTLSHVHKFPADADYINMLHDWAAQADGDGKAAGKKPPYWTQREYRLRENFPAIKRAFQQYGEERHSKRSLSDIGWSLEREEL